MSKTLFISDLHLDAQSTVTTEIFLRFLERDALQAEALYILGDFFEAWVGDDDLSDYHQCIITALANTTRQGLPIYFMHGNRDFLLGKDFFCATGCQLLPDQHVINLYGTPTLLLHGDTLCTLDTKYIKTRKLVRNKFIQWLFLRYSLKKRQTIAAQLRIKSREHTHLTPDYIMDVTQAEVERIMQTYGARHLIHGHTHREGVHRFWIGNEEAKRTVLGAWHQDGRALVCEENGEQTLISLAPVEKTQERET